MNTLTVNKIFHKKKWNEVTVKVHVEPPPILPIKSKNGDKWDKHFGKK